MSYYTIMGVNDDNSDIEPIEPTINAEIVLLLTEAQPRVFGFLLKRLGCRDQASEVLQNVNLTVCRKADEFLPGSDFISWVFTIARFQLLAYRQARARDKLVFSSELHETINLLDDETYDEHPFSERKRALEACMQQLPAHQHDLVIKRYAESFSVKALAADIGKTTNAISMTLHRIRVQLLECIKHRLNNTTND